MARLKLYFTYDGTAYNGWQRQKNTPNTIQEVLENKISMLANTKVSILASGRTDAGVHARIQVAHVDVPNALVDAVEPNVRLKKSLNSLLPLDIRILMIERVVESFHAITGVVKKTYLYFIDPNPIQLPELRAYSWHLRLPLDWPAIEEATGALAGEHNFKALCAADSSAKTSVRTLYEAHWGVVHWRGISASCELRALRLTGSGFLKHMVRSIAGTLMHIGNAKARPELISKCLSTGDRSLAGPTAPPHGLWLWDILYLP